MSRSGAMPQRDYIPVLRPTPEVFAMLDILADVLARNEQRRPAQDDETGKTV